TQIRSGSTPKCSHAKKRPVRAKPVCTSSATSRMPCRSQSRRRPSMKSRGATTKPPSPCTGSTTIAATDCGATCITNARSSASILVRERQPVDLRRERSQAVLVGLRLRGERERQVRPSVERALERDHRGAPRREAGELDGVLDRLRTRVEERRLDGPRDRRQL